MPNVLPPHVREWREKKVCTIIVWWEDLKSSQRVWRYRDLNCVTARAMVKNFAICSPEFVMKVETETRFPETLRCIPVDYGKHSVLIFIQNSC